MFHRARSFNLRIPALNAACAMHQGLLGAPEGTERKRNDPWPILAAEQIESRGDVGRMFLREHEPDAVWMLANDCFLEFVGHGFHHDLPVNQMPPRSLPSRPPA